MAGCSKSLSAHLMQNVRPAPIIFDDLEKYSLPNPVMGLMFVDQLERNAQLIDQQFHRDASMSARRLVCAMDGTYLIKQLQQLKHRGEPYLVGCPWSPNDETTGLIPLASPTTDIRKCPRAPMMMEFLTWDPNSTTRRTLSIASMPMALAATRKEGETLTYAGNMEMLRVVGRLMETAHWIIKGLTFDAHHSHRFIKDVLFGSFHHCSKETVSDIPFFRDLVYHSLPRHHLPYLPVKLCLHQQEAIWCLAGTCAFISMICFEFWIVLMTFEYYWLLNTIEYFWILLVTFVYFCILLYSHWFSRVVEISWNVGTCLYIFDHIWIL